MRAEDDVVEVWSCDMDRPNISKERSEEYKDSHTGKNAFIIDTRPDLKNLDYIKIDTSPVRMERKKWRYHKDLPIKKLNKHVTRKLLNKGQKMRTYNQSSTGVSKTRDKKSEKENSDREHKLREIIIDGCNVAMAYDSIFYTFTTCYTYIFNLQGKNSLIILPIKIIFIKLQVTIIEIHTALYSNYN